ncbi:zinc finger protein 513 [Galendromus occidentalis]|uniref:Zinc finger protein 513 n=1 Tax=Galendromus occidentalis TaxID=34638 RepID=A0AAJ6QTL0_9ACAR|nr:zinc finger protein 513 [Galendromus occidentalis]
MIYGVTVWGGTRSEADWVFHATDSVLSSSSDWLVPDDDCIQIKTERPDSPADELSAADAGEGGEGTQKPTLDATMASNGIFYCNKCAYSTRSTQTLRYHMYKHQPQVKKPFQCPFCPFNAYMRSHLGNHLLIHTGERPQPCPKCPYRAREKTALKRHLRAKHGVFS